jgi:PHP family Zn ribbon phosphoesterase
VSADRYVAEMFSGGKAALLPIYEELLKLGRSLGADVKVCPCQTMVPFYRNHVFGQIKPSTRDRIDLGLALKDTKVPKRLIDTGGFAKKDRITHRIEINSVNDIDDEVKRWLKKAYDMDAEARRGKPPAKRTA